MNCPGDAVEHWYLNKKRCSENAQKFGVPSLIDFMSKVTSEPSSEKRQLMLTGTDFLNYWQALRSGSQAAVNPRVISNIPGGGLARNCRTNG